MTIEEYMERYDVSKTYIALIAGVNPRTVDNMLETGKTKSRKLKDFLKEAEAEINESHVEKIRRKFNRNIEREKRCKPDRPTDIELLIAYMLNRKKGKVTQRVGNYNTFEAIAKDKFDLEVIERNKFRQIYSFEIKEQALSNAG